MLAGPEPYQGFPHLSELEVRGANLGVGGEREFSKLYTDHPEGHSGQPGSAFGGSPLGVLRGPNHSFKGAGRPARHCGANHHVCNCSCSEATQPEAVAGENALVFLARLTWRLFATSFLKKVKFLEEYLRNHSNGLRQGWVDQ